VIGYLEIISKIFYDLGVSCFLLDVGAQINFSKLLLKFTPGQTFLIEAVMHRKVVAL